MKELGIKFKASFWVFSECRGNRRKAQNVKKLKSTFNRSANSGNRNRNSESNLVSGNKILISDEDNQFTRTETQL